MNLAGDARGFRDKYRAWDTPDQGIEATIALIRDSRRYQKSWALLQTGDPRWYGQLGLDGYYEGPPDWRRPGVHTQHTPETIAPVQREYGQIVELVQRYDSPVWAVQPASLRTRRGGHPSGAVRAGVGHAASSRLLAA